MSGTGARENGGDHPTLVPVEDIAKVTGFPPWTAVDNQHAVLLGNGIKGKGLEVVVRSTLPLDRFDPCFESHGYRIYLYAVVQPQGQNSLFDHFFDREIEVDSPAVGVYPGEVVVPNLVSLLIFHHDPEIGAQVQVVLQGYAPVRSVGLENHGRGGHVQNGNVGGSLLASEANGVDGNIPSRH